MTDNNGLAGDDPGERAVPPIDDNFRAGLALLWQAHEYALDAGADVWDFALESESLYAAKLTISDLRWLVAKGSPSMARRRPSTATLIARSAPVRASTSSPRAASSSRPKAEFAGGILKEPAAAR